MSVLEFSDAVLNSSLFWVESFGFSLWIVGIND